jgi:hypothetical protein
MAERDFKVLPPRVAQLPQAHRNSDWLTSIGQRKLGVICVCTIAAALAGIAPAHKHL